MGHPAINEFCRIFALDQMRPQAFRRFQRVFRDEVQPQLDERERLLEENAALKAEIETLREQQAGAKAVGKAAKRPQEVA